MRQEFEYENFKYILDENNNHIVETNPKRENPKSIFKYYAFSENSIDALKKGYLYATHPFLFNDSIDSSELILNFKNLTLERFIGFYKRFLIPEEFSKYDFPKVYEEDKIKNFYNMRNFFYTTFSRNLGLISLTTKPFNILMWSHYTNEKGFTVELQTKEFIEDLKKNNLDLNNYCFRPVQYVKDVEFIEMFNEKFSTPDVPFLYMTTVKREEWKYEDEWRLSVYKNDMGIPFSTFLPGSQNYEGKNERKLFYDKSIIKSISLGKHFFNGKNCSKVNSDISFEISDALFLDFVNFLYENYNDKLLMSGEYESDSKLKRSLGKIQLEKINDKTFKIIDKESIHLAE